MEIWQSSTDPSNLELYPILQLSNIRPPSKVMDRINSIIQLIPTLRLNTKAKLLILRLKIPLSLTIILSLNIILKINNLNLLRKSHKQIKPQQLSLHHMSLSHQNY
jgi:hypothetical protein